MKKFIILLLILFASPVLATNLPPGVTPNGGDASSTIVTLPSSPNSVSLSQLNATTIHTAAFGSYCDGTHHFLSSITNYAGQNSTGWTVTQWQTRFPTLPNGANLNTSDIDGLAISAAFQNAATLGGAFQLKIDGAQGNSSGQNAICFATYSINWSGVTKLGSVIDASGVTIRSFATGKPAIDMTNSSFFSVYNLNINGNNASEPYSGLRLARFQIGLAAGSNFFSNLRVNGNFSHCAFENISTEVNTFINPTITNSDTSGNAFSYCADGINHFNYQASEPYQASATEPVDSYASFTQNIFIGGNISCNGVCLAPMWASSMNGMSMEQTYLVNSTTSGTAYDVILYEHDTSPNKNITFNTHQEAPNGLKCNFLISGDNATPNLPSFRFVDESAEASTAVFCTDNGTIISGSTAITSVTFTNAWLEVPFFGQGQTPTLFDNASLYSGGGHVGVPFQSNWTFPGGLWTGEICIAGNCNKIVPTPVLNRNPDFVYDAPWEHALVPATSVNLSAITDGYLKTLNGSAGGHAAFQNVSAGGCNGTTFGERATVTSTYSVATGDELGIRQTLAGPDIANMLLWGTASAQPITFDFWASASQNGNIAFDVQNGNGTRHYVTDIALTTSCREYIIQIPGYTGGAGFSNTAGVAGIRYGWVYDCGATYQISTGSWQTVGAISTACSANTSHFLATNANVITLSSVHMFAGYYLQQFQRKTDFQATSENARWFSKSLPIGVGPSANNTYQNDGAVGAYTFSARIAGTGSNTQSVWVSFPTPMAGITAGFPTVTGFSTSANTANCYDATGAADSGTLTISNVSNLGFEATCILGASVAAGDTLQFNWTSVNTQ